MEEELSSHGWDENGIIKNMTVSKNGGEYNFYQAKDTIDEAYDIDTALEVCDVGFTCYEKIIKKHLKVGLATTSR